MSTGIEFDDGWENGFYWFVDSLRALASSPEEACAQFGHFNVAGELWLEGRGGTYLWSVSQHRLSPSHMRLITELAAALDQLPPEAIAYTEIAQESLSRLQRPAWSHPRRLAGDLLAELSDLIASNQTYLDSPKAI